MSSMRPVRKGLRKEIMLAIKDGDGHPKSLAKIADRLLGRVVGYETLIKTFCANEVRNALAQLRLDGLAESTGMLWKAADCLESEDVDIISVRRLKRLRGELESEIRMANQYGRLDDSKSASMMLGIVTARLAEVLPPVKAETEEAVAVG